jgi:hypothetical protein
MTTFDEASNSVSKAHLLRKREEGPSACVRQEVRQQDLQQVCGVRVPKIDTARQETGLLCQ